MRLSRRHILGAALFGWFGFPLLASADAEWCFGDPPVLVRLPSGKPINLAVLVTMPQSQVSQVNEIETSATVAPAGAGSSLVTVQIVVPSGGAGPFAVQASANATRYQVSASAAGNADQPIVLNLLVPAT